MSSSGCSEGSSEFIRVRAVLKELGKENLLDVFKGNELTVSASSFLLKSIHNFEINKY